jgi:hypothetical protein
MWAFNSPTDGPIRAFGESNSIEDNRTIAGHTIELTRRSIQSYVEISFFPLDESGSPSAVNNTFLNFRFRDK